MNVQEYISSGIVESYVLGLASEEEKQQFEQACVQYPEILKARNDFELALEKAALNNTVSPPAATKSNLLQEISKDNNLTNQFKPIVRRINGWKIAAAACMLFLAGSLYWISALSKQNKSLQKKYDETVSHLNDMDKDFDVMTNSKSVKMAAMKGQSVSPQSYSTVYWDTASHDVYLFINNLPKPADEMQYQLWAFVNGKPVDMGLIDNQVFVNQKKLLIKAKNAQNAEAFAITLEKKNRPDISKPEGVVYVAGNL